MKALFLPILAIGVLMAGDPPGDVDGTAATLIALGSSITLDCNFRCSMCFSPSEHKIDQEVGGSAMAAHPHSCTPQYTCGEHWCYQEEDDAEDVEAFLDGLEAADDETLLKVITALPARFAIDHDRQALLVRACQDKYMARFPISDAVYEAMLEDWL